jgi:hypothetical protein
MNNLICLLRFQYENDVRFFFTSSCLWEGSCSIYVICVCLRVVVSKMDNPDKLATSRKDEEFLFWGYRYPQNQTFLGHLVFFLLHIIQASVCILISCLIYVICICLQNSGVKHILCCVFSSSFLDVANLSGLSIFDTTTRKQTQIT